VLDTDYATDGEALIAGRSESAGGDGRRRVQRRGSASGGLSLLFAGNWDQLLAPEMEILGCVHVRWLEL